jgi:hypothetical protein
MSKKKYSSMRAIVRPPSLRTRRVRLNRSKKKYSSMRAIVRPPSLRTRRVRLSRSENKYSSVIAIVRPPSSPRARRVRLKWWYEMLREHGSYPSYALFLAFPSNRDAISYFTNYGDEIDFMAGDDTLMIALGNAELEGSDVNKRAWGKAVEEQISKGHSVNIAKLFDIDFTILPCLVLFRSILSPEHVVVTFREMSPDEIRDRMQAVFTTIHKAVSEKADPVAALKNQQNRDAFLAKGQTIVVELGRLAWASFATLIRLWIEAKAGI